MRPYIHQREVNPRMNEAAPPIPVPEKWTHLSAKKSMFIEEALSRIEKYAQMELPDGMKAGDLENLTVGELLDYAESVLRNDTLWTEMPDSFSLGAGTPMTKEKLKAGLNELIEESR